MKNYIKKEQKLPLYGVGPMIAFPFVCALMAWITLLIGR